MRRIMLGVAVLAGLASAPSSSRAQVQNFGDPFFQYYGFFLPRQQALLNQPGPEVGIAANQQMRAQMAVTDRAGLYDPVGEIGAAEMNSATPFAGRTMGSSRIPRNARGGMGIPTSHINGSGPGSYYNRFAGYYPTMRSGRSRGSRGGAVMGGAPMGGGGANYGMTNMSGFMPSATSGMSIPGFRGTR
jgi:hypothetical protein